MDMKTRDSLGRTWLVSLASDGSIDIAPVGHTTSPEALSREEEDRMADELEAELAAAGPSEVDPFERAHDAWKESRLAA